MYTLFILIVFSITATYIGVNALAALQLEVLENEIQSAKQQAKCIAQMAESGIESDRSEEKIAQDIQFAIDGSGNKNVYLSVFDWSKN